MRAKTIAFAGLVAAAALLATAGTASAHVLPGVGAALTAIHVPFALTVNGGAEVTRQPLAVHQVITCGGVAHTVELVREVNGTFTVVLSPRLTASAVCST